MAHSVTLSATARSNTGKGAARSLRRQGRVPAVIYGSGREPESLSVEAAELSRALQGASAASVVDVSVDGRAPVKALLREVQRNPVRPADIIHLDFYEIHAGEKVTVTVPVHLIGVPDGVRNFGGVMDHTLHKIEIEADPTEIPSHIDIDVTSLGIGRSVHVSDVSLPGVTILTDGDQTICTVVAPRAEAAAPTPGETGSEPELIRKPKPDEDAPAKG